MPISLTCPHCGTSTKVADEYVGETRPCGHCGGEITIDPSRVEHSATFIADLALRRARRSWLLCIVGTVGLALGTLVILPHLWPDPQTIRRGHRANCSNNLRQIALALHDYQRDHRSLPPAYTVDEDGRRLHSWRTFLLPYLEAQNLYDKIRLDEPWDSPHNRGFDDLNFPIYRCPNNPDRDLSYMVVVGPRTLFPGAEAVSMEDAVGGLSNTLLLVEVRGFAGSWMEPVDLEFDELVDNLKLLTDDGATSHAGGFNVAFADGSTRFVAMSIDRDRFRAMLTRDGGEDIADGD